MFFIVLFIQNQGARQNTNEAMSALKLQLEEQLQSKFGQFVQTYVQPLFSVTILLF